MYFYTKKNFKEYAKKYKGDLELNDLLLEQMLIKSEVKKKEKLYFDMNIIKGSFWSIVIILLTALIVGIIVFY